MKTTATFAILAASFMLTACGPRESATIGPDKVTQKPFTTGGHVTLDIDGGDCDVRLAADATLRVTLSGNTGHAVTDVNVNGARADIAVKNVPHNNFHCTVDVPKADELRVNLGGGSLQVANVAADMNIQGGAGDIRISVGDASDYSAVDAAVGVGELKADPFGGAQSGLASSLHWTGPGKRVLTAHVGAGSLSLKN